MLFVNLDLSPLLSINNIADAAQKAAREACQALTVATHAHIVEAANDKLHTRRAKYIEALSYHQVDDDTWVVNLDSKAVWIEDGMPEHELIQDLLKSKSAKTAKDGSRYLSIPFEHGPKGASKTTPAQATLLATIKKELSDRQVPYAKIERDAQGQAKLGKLHSFDITNAPIRTGAGPGQGKGPVGQVMQGPSGIPLLKGVQIYQTKVKGKGGEDRIKRSIMTFRTVSSKDIGSGKWVHPGLEAKHFFEEAQEWAKNEWEKRIAPEIVAKLIASVG